MPALHALPALLAPAHMNVELDQFHLGLWYLGLILLLDLGLFQFAAAARTTNRQFGLQRSINRSRNRSPAAATIPGSGFPPRLGGMGFGSTPRKWRRLPFRSPSRLFQSA
jgi:hypothetical protein